MISLYKEEMQQMAKIYGEETEKDFREQLDDIDTWIIRANQDPAERANEEL
jgi:ABC-type enterochelin transport system substrate-binding protein